VAWPPGVIARLTMGPCEVNCSLYMRCWNFNLELINIYSLPCSVVTMFIYSFPGWLRLRRTVVVPSRNVSLLHFPYLCLVGASALHDQFLLFCQARIKCLISFYKYPLAICSPRLRLTGREKLCEAVSCPYSSSHSRASLFQPEEKCTFLCTFGHEISNAFFRVTCHRPLVVFGVRGLTGRKRDSTLVKHGSISRKKSYKRR